MTRARSAAIALTIALAVALVPATSAAAATKPTTCKSGKTRYAEGGVRIFQVSKRFTDLNGSYQQFLACRPGSRKPVVLDTSSFMTTVKWRGATRTGANVIFEVEHSAETNSSVNVGWLRPGSGAHRSGSVLDEVGRPVAVAVAGDGGVVVVLDSLPSGGQRDELIAYMAVGAKGKLKDPRVIAGVTGGVVHSSLTIDGNAVTWMTNAGAPGRAAFPAASAANAASLGAVAAASTKRKPTTCKSGRTRFVQGGVRIFELKRTDSDDLPYSLFLICSPRSARPVVIYAGSHGGTTVEWVGAEIEGRRVIWQVDEFADGGGAVTVGWFSTNSGAMRVGAVDWKYGRPLATAVAADGAIAVVTPVVVPIAGGSRTDELVLYMAPGRKRLHAPRLLTTVTGGGIEPASLLVGNGLVSWTQAGVPASIPIGAS